MAHAVISGSSAYLPDAEGALKDAGFEILSAGWSPPDDVSTLGPIDCYLQLPNDDSDDDNGARLLHRFDCAARAAGFITPSGVVVLVADGWTDPGLTRENRGHRRLPLLLTEAVLRDHGLDDDQVILVSDPTSAVAIVKQAERAIHERTRRLKH
ncbi:MAG: hypothetical protein AB1679_12455 [Actinomycetota bacterium]|jgi:hypothetical protein